MKVLDRDDEAIEIEGSRLRSGVPEGWVLTTIQEACELNPAKPPRDYLSNDAPVTFVPMPAVDAEAGAIVSPEDRPFAEVRNGYTAFRDGDVIMAKITPCMENGKAAIARGLTNGLGFGSTEFHVMRPNGAAIAEYLFYYVRQESFRAAAEAEMTGSVGQRRVPERFLAHAPIPVPPLAEQHRIVAQIEALTSRTAVAERRLARARDILTRLRQSVLAAACSGRLSVDWRREYNYSSGRLRSDRKELMASDSVDVGELPDGWVCASVDQITNLVTSGSRGWAKYYSNSGPLFIRAQDINTDELDIRDVAHVNPPHSAEGLRTRVYPGDLLVTITGANVTKSALVDVDIGEAYVSQHVALVRPIDLTISRFLYLWVISPAHGRQYLTDAAYGAGKPGLNLDNIRHMAVALPPLAEQHEIVRRVEALFKLADAVEGRVVAATTRVEKLTQAVLAKAFRGELVPTEAELARIEGREYEPADTLLARIRAERGRQSRSDRMVGRRRGRARATGDDDRPGRDQDKRR